MKNVLKDPSDFDMADVSTTGRKPCKSKLFDKSFSHKSTLSEHSKDVHPTKKTFRCVECGKCFAKKCGLLLHSRSHLGQKSYTCKHCHKSFGCLSGLKEHVLIHTGEQNVKCEKCGKAVPEEDNLRPQNRKKPYICELCRITSKDRLTIKIERIVEGKSFICEHCGNLFDQDSFRSHLMVHRKGNQDSSQGNTQRFGTKIKDVQQAETAENKIDAHTNEKPFRHGADARLRMMQMKHRIRIDQAKGRKNHTCNLCNKSYSQKYTLVEHIRSHTGEKPYRCYVCGKCYAYRSAFGYHLKSHRFRDPVICGKCGKHFSSNSALNVHKRLHTGEKPFICDICGNAYSRKDSLNIHKKTKTHLNNTSCGKRSGLLKKKKKSVKRVKCMQCNKVFCSKWSFRVHNRTHTGEKPFMCERCGKSFAHKNSLDDHIMRHNQEELKKGECHNQLEITQEQWDSDAPAYNMHGYLVPNVEQNTSSKTCENNVEVTEKNIARTTENECEAVSEKQKKPFSAPKVHFKGAHTKIKLYKCDQCGRSFSKKCALVIHVRSHAGRYKCEECHASFRCKSRLEAHQCNASGQNLYKCIHCGKGFSSNDSLDVHTKTHSGEAPYTSEQCGSRLANKVSFPVHFMKHGGRQNMRGLCDKPLKDRLYLIAQIKKPGTMRAKQSCSNSLSDNNSPGIFFRKQTVEKPFWCMECGKSFPLKFHLSRHLKTHMSSRSENVKAHISRHAREKQNSAKSFNQTRYVNGLMNERLTANSDNQDDQMTMDDSTHESTGERSTNGSMQNYERRLKDFLSTFVTDGRKQKECNSEYIESPCPVTPTHVHSDLTLSEEKDVNEPSFSEFEQISSVAPDSSVNNGFQQPSLELFDSSAGNRFEDGPEYFTQPKKPIYDTVSVKPDMAAIEETYGTIMVDICSGDYAKNGESGGANNGSPSTNSCGNDVRYNEQSGDENVDVVSVDNYRTDSVREKIQDIVDTAVVGKYWKDTVPCKFLKSGKLRSNACETQDKKCSADDSDKYIKTHADKSTQSEIIFTDGNTDKSTQTENSPTDGNTDKSTQTENAHTDGKAITPETGRCSQKERAPLQLLRPPNDANTATVGQSNETLEETADSGTDNRCANGVAFNVKSEVEIDVTRTGNSKNYRNCNKNIDSKRPLEAHHPQRKQIGNIKCAECGKSFYSKYNLRVHTRTHTGEKPFVCKKCGCRYAHNASLQAHLVKHAEQGDRFRVRQKKENSVKPLTCEICSKSFSGKTGLIIHTRVHTGERPFSCELCGKAFFYPNSLKKHSKTHLRKGISK